MSNLEMQNVPVFRNYEKSFIIREVFSHLRICEKQPWKQKNSKWFWLSHGEGLIIRRPVNRSSEQIDSLAYCEAGSFAMNSCGLFHIYYLVIVIRLFHVDQCWTNVSFWSCKRISESFLTSSRCNIEGIC